MFVGSDISWVYAKIMLGFGFAGAFPKEPNEGV